MAPDGGGGDGGGGGGGGGEAGPAAGLKLIGKPVRVAGNGRTVILGKATNPPTARTIQTLTVPAARAARASASRTKDAKKNLVVGRGKAKVADGKTAKLKLKLNRRGRAKLRKKGKLKARLTVVAVNAAGEKQTVTRRVTIRPAKRKKRS